MSETRNRHVGRLTPLLCLLCLLWQGGAAAQIYQWKDAQGRTHFSQTPPPSGSYTERRLPPSPPPSTDSAERMERLIEQQKQARKTREEQKKKAQQEEKNRKIREQNCQTARNLLTTLQSRPRIRMTAADGSMTILTEEQRQARIEEARKRVKEFCD